MKSVSSVLIAFALCHAAAESMDAMDGMSLQAMEAMDDPGQASGLSLSKTKFKQYATAFFGVNGSESMLSDFFDDDDDAPSPKKAAAPSTKKAAALLDSSNKVKANASAPPSALSQLNAFMGSNHMGDSDKANVRGTKKSVQHGTALLDKTNVRSTKANIRGTSKSGQKLTAHTTNAAAVTVKATAAAKAESHRVKVDTVRTVAAASSEDGSSVQLKKQLSQALRVEFGLRKRLKQLGTEARSRLGQVLKGLQVAKAGAMRTQMKLQNEIQKETEKWKKAEASESDLRTQLAAAKASLLSADRTGDSVLKAAKARVDKLRKVDSEVADKLREELKTTQTQAAQETKKLRDQLQRLQQAAAKAQSQLTHQAVAQKETIELRNEIKKETSKREQAEASELAAEMKAQMAASKSQKEEAELRKELAAAKASVLSATKAAAAAKAQAAAKEIADRKAVSKLREEFLMGMNNLKREEAEASKASKETSMLRDQIRQLRQANATAQSQVKDQPPKPVEVAQSPKPIEVSVITVK